MNTPVSGPFVPRLKDGLLTRFGFDLFEFCVPFAPRVVSRLDRLIQSFWNFLSFVLEFFSDSENGLSSMHFSGALRQDPQEAYRIILILTSVHTADANAKTNFTSTNIPIMRKEHANNRFA